MQEICSMCAQQQLESKNQEGPSSSAAAAAANEGS
jgi:hypothetical protein